MCYWFEKARAEIEAGRSRRAGLLATNSVWGGANREVLKRTTETGGIFMAYSDEPWVLDGAAVRVSMVGFDDGSEQEHVLGGMPVAAIWSNFTAAADVTVVQALPENRELAFIGLQKGGPFDIDGETERAWLRLPNPSGVSNEDVVKPYVNGMDLMHT